MDLRWAVALLVLVPTVASCSDDDDGAEPDGSTTTSAPLYESSFEPGDCPVDVDAPERVTCGTVTVPERHADPDGPTIDMAVALIEPETADPEADPLLLLQGGPGSGFVGLAQFLLDAPIVDDRTMVLVDPRGTGHSKPFLGCSELDDIDDDLLGVDPDSDEARSLQHDAVVACRARLVDDGVDLQAYNYTEIASDLTVLRDALEYDGWDVYGISNGGRMALELLRRHPEGIRSLVLDAAAPPQGNLFGELWPHAQVAFDALAAGCAESPACGAAHPDLGETIATLVERLTADPVTVQAEDGVTGEMIDVRIDEAIALEALRSAMYDTGLIPILPRYIGLLDQGEGFTDVAGLLAGSRPVPGTFSHGMSLSVTCQEEIAFLPEDFYDKQAAELPLLASVIENPTKLDDCDVWDVGRADPSVEEPVVSDVPALVLTGEYDPVHPLASSEAIASTLANAQLFEIPGLGHGTVRVHECPLAMTRAFLDDPSAAVDDACIAEMPPPAWLP